MDNINKRHSGIKHDDNRLLNLRLPPPTQLTAPPNSTPPPEPEPDAPPKPTPDAVVIVTAKKDDTPKMAKDILPYYGMTGAQASAAKDMAWAMDSPEARVIALGMDPNASVGVDEGVSESVAPSPPPPPPPPPPNIVNNALAVPNISAADIATATNAQIKLTVLVTDLTTKIYSLSDTQLINGLTGAQIKEAWSKNTFQIEPPGSTYGNPGVGGVFHNADGTTTSKLELNGLVGYQSSSLGAQIYQLLHDGVGHSGAHGKAARDTNFAQHLANGGTAANYDDTSPQFRANETNATNIAQAVASAIGVPFTYPSSRGY